MMEEYKPNSNRFKEQQKAEVPAERQKQEKIVKGTVQTRKRNEIRKLTDVFISEEAPNVKSYILMDVLVPAIKDAIEDIVTNGIRMILRGETGSRKSSTAGRVSYSRYYDRRDDDRRSSVNRTRTGYSYDEITLDNRGEAEEVLTRMDELIETYGHVSVADLYDLVGITGNFTDNNYGWTNIRNAEVVRVRNGYLIKMPKALPLDRR